MLRRARGARHHRLGRAVSCLERFLAIELCFPPCESPLDGATGAVRDRVAHVAELEAGREEQVAARVSLEEQMKELRETREREGRESERLSRESQEIVTALQSQVEAANEVRSFGHCLYTSGG